MQTALFLFPAASRKNSNYPRQATTLDAVGATLTFFKACQPLYFNGILFTTFRLYVLPLLYRRNSRVLAVVEERFTHCFISKMT